jgi:spore germination protein KA
MFRLLYKKMRVSCAKQRKQPSSDDRRVKKNLDKNIEAIKQSLGDSADIKLHDFFFGPDAKHGTLLFVDGLVDTKILTDTIMRPLMETCAKAPTACELKSAILCSGDVTETSSLDALIEGSLTGDTAVILDGESSALIVSTKGWDKRGVTEPQSEAVVRGSREGFTENFRTNTAMLRRRIKSPQLRMDHMTIGEKTSTSVCVAYLNGVAPAEVVAETKSRLNALVIDSVLDTGYLEQYIEDAPMSIFPTVAYTEKPDVAAGRILEGRVAIIADGTPFVLTVPKLFIESFQTSEDYYIRPLYASATRILRFFAYVVAAFAPAIYIALTTFHQELIPTTLLVTIAASREGTPFPAFIEALVMVIAYEILREAGVRLPRPVGSAISIVGALIMGDAAVSAGIVGAPMVITIAITAVAGFVVPDQTESAAFLRLISMVAAAFLGGYGIAIVFLAMLIHLASLKSFGVPYFTGITYSREQQDIFVRMPLWMMRQRPADIAAGDITRRRTTKPPPTGGPLGGANDE